jgi:hypothetical protein
MTVIERLSQFRLVMAIDLLSDDLYRFCRFQRDLRHIADRNA